MERLSRPGPKSSQKEVKTEIFSILAENLEGVSFNQLFRLLKSKGVLGSFSVLSSALKDLKENNIISYEDESSTTKIPRRVYTLSDSKRQLIITLNDSKHRLWNKLYSKIRGEGTSIPLENMVSNEIALRHLFLNHALNLVFAYNALLEEHNPSDKSAVWRLLVNTEFKIMQNAMENVATAVSEGKTSISDARSTAEGVQAQILKLFAKVSEL